MTTYVGIGTAGPRPYTRAEADALLVTYAAHIKPGTQIRITDEGVPAGVGQVCVYDGTAWVQETDAGGSSGPVAWTSVTGKPTFATVATSGSFTDLFDVPAFAPVAFTGVYADLTSKPSLFSGSYTDLTNTPSLFSGSYTDLTNKPTLSAVAATGAYADLTGKPALATVATSGAYTDLTGSPTLATVATSGAYADLTGTPAPFPVMSNAYIVSKTGNDSTGDGSMAKPFATLQKAHDVALATYTINDAVVIIVYPGGYSGALNWARPRTTIYGFAGSASATSLSGAITINSSIDTSAGNPFNNVFGFQNVLFGGSGAGDAITMTGTVPAMLVLDSVKFASTVANKRAVVMNITNATKSICHWQVVDSKMAGGGSAAFDLANVDGYARQFTSETDDMPSLFIRTGRLFINGGGFESNSTTSAAVVVGDGSATAATFQASNVYVLQDAQNGDSVNVLANGIAILDDVQLDAWGTGFAVNGVAGGQVLYAYLTFGGHNGTSISTKIAAALTSTAIPTAPTFV